MAKGDALAKEGKGADAAAQYRQAAEVFDKYAAESKESADAPNALFNAALAWDKAKEPKKAIADREQILAAYPDAMVARQTTVLLGGGLAAAREYTASAKYNELYLRRWPDGPHRCAVMQNLGLAQQETKKTQEAVQTYLAFANDPACSAEDPNNTARVLYSAAKLQVDQKKTADAKKTLQQLVGLKGVTDVVAKSYQADAKERLAKMK
jgi:TolA-binding protein